MPKNTGRIPDAAFKWKGEMIGALTVAELNTFTYIFAGEDGKVGLDMKLQKVYEYTCILRMHSEENFSPRKGTKVSINLNINDRSHVDTADVLVLFLANKGYSGATVNQFTTKDKYADEDADEISHDYVNVQVTIDKLVDFCKLVIKFVENFNEDKPESIIPPPPVKAQPNAPAAATTAASSPTKVATQPSPSGSWAARVETVTTTSAPAPTLADEEKEIAKMEQELAAKKQQFAAKKETVKEAAFQQMVCTYKENGLSLDEAIARLEALRAQQQATSA